LAKEQKAGRSQNRERGGVVGRCKAAYQEKGAAARNNQKLMENLDNYSFNTPKWEALDYNF